MSDFRNLDNDPFDPNDPYRSDAKLDPNLRPANAVTGWVVAAVFAVAILAVIFGLAHQPGQLGTNTASNDMGPNTPPAATHMAPPVTPSGTSSPQTTPHAPISPTPAPAPSGDQQ